MKLPSEQIVLQNPPGSFRRWIKSDMRIMRWVFLLLYLAIVGSSFTFLLLYWLMPRMSVTNLQTISLITPPGAIAIGWAFGGERLSIMSLLGAAPVLLGVWMFFRAIEEPNRARAVAAGDHPGGV